MSQGALRVISEGELQQRDAEERETAISDERAAAVETSLGNYIRKTWDEFKRHRTSEDLTQRHLDALRAYKGEYDQTKRQEITQFGGSDVFARITSVKCRGATALLRDIYLGAHRPWGVEPTPMPELPTPISETIDTVVQQEAQTLEGKGVAVNPNMLEERRRQLYQSAFKAGLKRAKEEARKAETKLEDILREGKFYDALLEFLIDLPIFLYAIIKGPVIQNVVDLKWENGQIVEKTVPKMFWYRVSPFDLYFTPGASDQEDTDIIERIRFRRAELNGMLGVKGYRDEAIKAIFNDHPDGFAEHLDESDSERADLESREDPVHDHGWYDSLEYHGSVLGKWLREYGFTAKEVPDEDRDYHVTAWLVGRHLIKVQLNPNPRRRHPYYMTSYEKVPGSLYGHGIPDIIADVQDVANSALRSLVNNMSISSGPQVAVNEERLSSSTNPDSLYPWKRWRFTSDPLMNNSAEKPIDFFQPQSNAQELLGVYSQMSSLADEISAIPRYMTGSEKVGGAARTASGLSMLMNNTAKVLQSVASNIDNDVIRPAIRQLYDTVLLTDKTGLLKGDENIVVKGVTMALQKDTDRMRRLEFLQIINNPIDAQVISPKHRAKILRHLADDLGLPEEEVVPTEEELEIVEQQQQQMMQAAAQAQGGQPPAPGSAPQEGLGQATDNMFRTQGAG